MTFKSKPDGRKLRRFKFMGTRTRDITANISAAASFGSKSRIENVRGHRIGIAVSSLRHLCLGEEKKMRFRRGEVVFHRWEIGTKTANVTEV